MLATAAREELRRRGFRPDPASFRRFRGDPLGFVRDGLREPTWSKQREVLAALATHRFVAVQACHGVGKSHVASRFGAGAVAAGDPGRSFLVTTAPTFQQVRAVLWRYLAEAHARHRLPGRILGAAEWWIGAALVGIGRKPADGDPAAFQGIHAEDLTLIFDEAAGIERSLWDAGLSLLTGDSGRWLAIGNPDDPFSAFAEVCRPGSGWHVIRISAFDAPAFTGEAVAPRLAQRLVGRDWVDAARRRWGEGSPLWRAKVLGEFPDVREDALLTADLVRAAAARALAPASPVELGVDIARHGTDSSVVALRRGGMLRIVATVERGDLMSLTGLVLDAARTHAVDAIKLDDVGVGGGVTDRLRELQREGDLPESCRIVAIIGSTAARDPARFANLRAELHWGLRLAFEDGAVDLDPTDLDLLAQLTSIGVAYDSRGRVRIEGKDDLKRRGRGSPDRADAAVLAFAPASSTPTPRVRLL